jgi:DNA-binding MarR family transcriptional regulator
MDTPTPVDNLSLPVLLRFARAAYAGAIGAAQEAAGCEDMPRNGTYVIGAIARGHAPLSDVIQALGMSKQAAGQLVDTLVLRGYLERAADPHDRRRLTLALTERGIAAAQATRAAIAGIDAALTERLGAESIARTKETLVALVAQAPSGAPTSPNVERKFDNRLESARFQNCSLAGALFDNVSLADASFNNVTLAGASLHNVNLSAVTITDANIKGLTILGHDVQTLIKAAKAL